MSSKSHELLTIQCGHYSNYIGTHWWNLQEAGLWYPPLLKGENDEIDSDCTFREGITLTGKETYTPRLLAIDLPGSLDTLKQEGHLYDTQDKESLSHPMWGGPLEKHVAEPLEKNRFTQDLDKLDQGEVVEEELVKKSYQLESSVKVWSDYLRPHLHPRSILMLPEFFHKDERFDIWPSGVQAWKQRKFQIELDDKLHFFLEECDNFQGFQLLFDMYPGGFGAVATSLGQLLHDDYKKPMIVFPTIPPLSDEEMSPQFRVQHIFNSLLTIPDIIENCSLCVPFTISGILWPTPSIPLVFPSAVQYNPFLPYHSAALLSSALETCTSCYRSPLYPETLGSFTGLLGNSGRKISSLSLNLNHNLPAVQEFSVSSNSILESLVSLTPHCDIGELWNQSVCFRGYIEKHSEPELAPDPRSAIIHHLYNTYPSTNSQLGLFKKPLVPNNPFPHIIDFIHSKSYNTAFSCTALQTHSGISSFLNTLLDHAHKCNPRLVPTYGSCLDGDTYLELLSNLKSLKDFYKTGSPSECSTDEEN